MRFHIISMATYGYGLSGGDRILIELSKILAKRYPLTIYLWEEGQRICLREGVGSKNLVLWSAKSTAKLGFVVNYFARIPIALWESWKLYLDNSPQTVVYSGSEFWQDSLAVLLLKIKYPKVSWVAAWYQTAPNPVIGFSEGERENRYFLKAWIYWLVQLPIKPLVTKYADLIIVNNQDEVRKFSRSANRKILVMLGAVDIKKISQWRKIIGRQAKVYDGVFQGRFHPQKGVIELMDIWKMVVSSKPDAKLAMIGDGPLMESVKLKIKNEKLEKNIKLFGYLFDGSEKYRIFSQSKVVVHPAYFDSGGMAAAEAMAFGLPVVGFDLAAYKSYYPKGMVKVRIGDSRAFASKVLKLLEESKLRHMLGREGLRMLNTNWSWESRAKKLVEMIQNLTSSSKVE